MGVQAQDNKKKYDKIREIKIATPIEVLCQGFPQEFEVYLKYCRSLKFEERPDYVWLKRLFKDLFQKLDSQWNLSFDWAELSVAIELEEKKNMHQHEEVPQNEELLTGVLEFNIKRAMNLPSMDMIDASDPYCSYKIYDIKKTDTKKKEGKSSLQDKKAKTSTIITDNNNPVWNFKQEASVSFAKANLENYRLLVEVFDKDSVSDEFIGKVEIPLAGILNKTKKLHKNIYDLTDKNGKILGNAQIEIELRFMIN